MNRLSILTTKCTTISGSMRVLFASFSHDPIYLYLIGSAHWLWLDRMGFSRNSVMLIEVKARGNNIRYQFRCISSKDRQFCQFISSSIFSLAALSWKSVCQVIKHIKNLDLLHWLSHMCAFNNSSESPNFVFAPKIDSFFSERNVSKKNKCSTRWCWFLSLVQAQLEIAPFSSLEHFWHQMQLPNSNKHNFGIWMQTARTECWVCKTDVCVSNCGIFDQIKQ